MKTLIIGLVLTSLICQANAAPVEAYTFGAGQQSCGSWTMGADNDTEVGAWILGYWSGFNVSNTTHSVGHSTDGYGVIGEVKKACQGDPSLAIMDAVANAYDKLGADGR